MRLPIASSIESRDGSLSKDAKLVNCFVDVEGETSFVVKRPGLRKSVSSAAGAGLGMVSWEGNMYHAIGLTFYQTSYASIPSGGGGAPSVDVSLYGGALGPSQWMEKVAYTGAGFFYVYTDPGSFYTFKSIDSGASWTYTISSDGSSISGIPLYFNGKIWIFQYGNAWWSSDAGVSWSGYVDLNGSSIPEISDNGPFLLDGSTIKHIKKIGSSAPTGVYETSNGTSWVSLGTLSVDSGVLSDMQG